MRPAHNFLDIAKRFEDMNPTTEQRQAFVILSCQEALSKSQIKDVLDSLCGWSRWCNHWLDGNVDMRRFESIAWVQRLVVRFFSLSLVYLKHPAPSHAAIALSVMDYVFPSIVGEDPGAKYEDASSFICIVQKSHLKVDWDACMEKAMRSLWLAVGDIPQMRLNITRTEAR